jgi:hypothetical protein
MKKIPDNAKPEPAHFTEADGHRSAFRAVRLAAVPGGHHGTELAYRRERDLGKKWS